MAVLSDERNAIIRNGYRDCDCQELLLPMTTYALSVTVAGQPFDMMQYNAAESLTGVFFQIGV